MSTRESERGKSNALHSRLSVERLLRAYSSLHSGQTRSGWVSSTKTSSSVPRR
jgi:hypothetical protein